MGSHLPLLGRGLCLTGLVLLFLITGISPSFGPSVAAAQDYEAMMPATLSHEVRKAEKAYREAIDAANAAETERQARKTVGAGMDELRALDEKVGQLVTKAEKLKVQADYLNELYETKRHEYRGR